MAYDFGLKKQICVFASDLASAIGQNPYRPKEETVLSVWKRFDATSLAFSLSLAHASEVFLLCEEFIKDKPMKFPLPSEVESEMGKQQFTASLKEIFSSLEWRQLQQKIKDFVDKKGLREAKEKVLLSSLGESKRVEQAIAALCQNEQKPVEDKVKEVCKEISKETGKTVDKQTEQALTSKLSRDRGTVLEAKTVDDFAAASGKAVRQEPRKSYRKVMTHNDVSWLLVGRVDARDESTIVEVKNRTRRFMCPEYDVLQLQAYMYLCDKSQGILLERLHGENRETPFEFNESYWNEVVVPALYEFVREVEDRVIMSRSILDGATPPLSPRKRTHGVDAESPIASKVQPSSPEVLQGSFVGNEAHQGSVVDPKVQLESPRVLFKSSWDSEPSSDTEQNAGVVNESFTLCLSPSETESDDELANLPLDE